MSLARIVVLDDLTPEELAIAFLEMDGERQAAFFNAFKATTDTWPGAGWCWQCCSLSEHLNRDGVETIAKLAEWAAEPYVKSVTA